MAETLAGIKKVSAPSARNARKKSRSAIPTPESETLPPVTVPESEQESFDRYVRSGLHPREAAFYTGIGSGRLTGDADVDFSLIDPALKGLPWLT